MAKKEIKTSDFIAWIEGLPLLLKILLALPLLDGIFYGFYRIFKGRLLLGIIWIFLGAAVLWIVDIISLIAYKKIKLLA